MKRMSFLMLVLVLLLTAGRKYPSGWKYIPMPEDDEFATNRFGRSWMEPIYEGYLIVGDKYIDAPYVIEQRGFVIFVNNERVADGADIRFVSPAPQEAPVTVDPGFPTNVSREASIPRVLANPLVIQKGLYWNNLGIYGEERLKVETEYFKSLPCIKEVVATQGSVAGDRIVVLFDFHGNSNLVALQTAPKPPFPTFADSELYGHINGEMGNCQYGLRHAAVIQILNACIRGPAGAVWDTNKWLLVFRSLADESLTPTQRLERIRATEAMAEEPDNHIMTMLPLNGFRPTTQLWQRLSGDTSWTNDAPARLFALTNGWRRIPPSFLRTQEQTRVTEPTGRTPPPERATARETPQPPEGDPAQADTPARATAAHSERRFPRGLSVGLVILLAIGAWLTLRRTRP